MVEAGGSEVPILSYIGSLRSAWVAGNREPCLKVWKEIEERVERQKVPPTVEEERALRRSQTKPQVVTFDTWEILAVWETRGSYDVCRPRFSLYELVLLFAALYCVNWQCC